MCAGAVTGWEVLEVGWPEWATGRQNSRGSSQVHQWDTDRLRRGPNDKRQGRAGQGRAGWGRMGQDGAGRGRTVQDGPGQISGKMMRQ